MRASMFRGGVDLGLGAMCVILKFNQISQRYVVNTWLHVSLTQSKQLF